MTLWPSGVGLFLLVVGIVLILVARSRYAARRAAAHQRLVGRVPATMMDFDDTESEAEFDARWKMERDRWVQWGFLSIFAVLGLYAIAVWVVDLSSPRVVAVSAPTAVVAPANSTDHATTETVAENGSPTTPAETEQPPATDNSSSSSTSVASGNFTPDCAKGAGRVFPVLEDPIPTDEASLTAVAKRLRQPAWDALRRLRATRPGAHLAGVAIIGSADSRPMSAERARYFGSNDGLAQARATIVGAALRNDPPEEAPPIVVIINAGTKIPGLELPSTTGGDNRAVLICAVWEAPAQQE